MTLPPGLAPPAGRGPYRSSQRARSTILAAVRANPGVSRSEILRLTGLGWGVVAHHVRGMVARGELHVTAIGRRPYYHAVPDSMGLFPVTRLLRTEEAAGDVLRLLNRSGACTIQDISRDLGVDWKTAKRHVGHLAEAGLVRRTAEPRPRFELLQVPLAMRAVLARGGPDAAKPPAPGQEGPGGAAALPQARPGPASPRDR